MRLTDFWDRMEAVFGSAYAHSWASDVVLQSLGVTVNGALAAGVDTKTVWRAVCEDVEVPSALV
jgi:hypothetical protein